MLGHNEEQKRTRPCPWRWEDGQKTSRQASMYITGSDIQCLGRPPASAVSMRWGKVGQLGVLGRGGLSEEASTEPRPEGRGAGQKSGEQSIQAKKGRVRIWRPGKARHV